MNDALAQIFALQQKEIKEQEQRRQRAAQIHDREVCAFQDSGLPDIVRALVAVPLRAEVRARIHLNKFGDITYQYEKRPRAKEITLMNLHGTGSGPQWWCSVSPDSDNINYNYNDGRHTSVRSSPDNGWLSAFLTFAAQACDPSAIAQKTTEALPNPTVAAQRRRVQPV